jgi:cold shock CspA family protein
MRGTMLWFNEVKDLGVITTEEGDGVRVLGADFTNGERPKRRCAGTEVRFGVIGQGDARRATDVSFVPEIAPRRARLRHARFRSGG